MRRASPYQPGTSIEVPQQGEFIVIAIGSKVGDKTQRCLFYCADSQSELYDRLFFVNPNSIASLHGNANLLESINSVKLHQYGYLAKIRVWRHYKGNQYLNLGIGVDLESNCAAIALQSLQDHNVIYIRPLDIFLDNFLFEDKNVERFTPVGGYKKANQ